MLDLINRGQLEIEAESGCKYHSCNLNQLAAAVITPPGGMLLVIIHLN